MEAVMFKTRKLRKRKYSADKFVKNIHGEFARLEYKKMGDAIALLYTEIPAKYRGKGHGTKMIREILDDLQRVYKKIIPICPFVEKFIDENPQYHVMVERWEA